MSTVGTAVAVGGLAAGFVLLSRTPRVRATTGMTGDGLISVIVPARDEEVSLPRLLASLAEQDIGQGGFEVVVVDDGSTDRAAAIARAARARVVSVDGPPPGWTGKAWACDVGVRAASGRLLVFLDADTRLAADGLRRLAAEHGREAPDGLLSVQPYHVTERAYEQLSAVCNIVPVMAAGLAAARPARSCRVAFGPCLVTTPDALRAAGGFESVRAEVVEDAALAARFRALGRRVHCRLGGDSVQFRMYSGGVRSLYEGWVKSLAGGSVRAGALPTAGAVLWVSGALAVSVALLRPEPIALGLWVAYAAQTWWMLRRLGRFRWWVAPAFPLPTLAFVVCFAASAAHRLTGRRVRWRGRRVPLGSG